MAVSVLGIAHTDPDGQLLPFVSFAGEVQPLRMDFFFGKKRWKKLLKFEKVEAWAWARA